MCNLSEIYDVNKNVKCAQNNAQFLCTYFSTKGCNRLYTILRKC